MNKYPKHAGYKSFREFKHKKRKAVVDTMKSLEELYLGCAYLPPETYRKVVELRETLESIKEDLSIKNYGR